MQCVRRRSLRWWAWPPDGAVRWPVQRRVRQLDSTSVATEVTELSMELLCFADTRARRVQSPVQLWDVLVAVTARLALRPRHLVPLVCMASQWL